MQFGYCRMNSGVQPSSAGETKLLLVQEGMEGMKVEKKIGSSIFYETQLTTSRDTMLYKGNEQPSVQFHFQYNGLTKSIKEGTSYETIGAPGLFYVNFGAGRSTRIFFHANDHYQSAGFQLPLSLFFDSWVAEMKNFTPLRKAIEDETVWHLSEHGIPMNHSLRTILSQIHNSPYQGDLQTFYLEHKLQDVFFSLDQVIGTPVQNRSSYKEAKLAAVSREYISKYYRTIRSFDQIVKAVGANEYSLKQAFRHTYGTSVMQFVMDCKLEEARNLVLHSDKSISEIAYVTGYSSAGNFSNAFFKKFGFRPASLRKE
jgi:AraC family transcriptional regulator, transcriptional activator of the genes for pyochelin and ferripyochelin receptors